MDIHEELKEVLMEGNLKLRNEGINKIQRIDSEIRMLNTRNREKKKLLDLS